jgi:hypothetical protein
MVTTSLDWWRRGIHQHPLPLLGNVVAHHALVNTFFITVYAWAALALSGPLLGVGWAIHTWVPKKWVTGVTLDLVYMAWMLGVRRLRPVVSQVLLGAMMQLRQVRGQGVAVGPGRGWVGGGAKRAGGVGGSPLQLWQVRGHGRGVGCWRGVCVCVWKVLCSRWYVEGHAVAVPPCSITAPVAPRPVYPHPPFCRNWHLTMLQNVFTVHLCSSRPC